MSDRFDKEAKKIDASNLSGNDYVAALLRAAVRMAKEDRDREAMEGTRAGELVEVMAGKPVAGEWIGDDGRSAHLCLVDTGVCVSNVYATTSGAWEWNVYNADCGLLIKRGTGCESSGAARDAAAGWARANPHLLDWQMPPASVEDKARGYTDAEVERMARAGDLARFGERMASLADRRFVERLISKGVAKDNWDTAVLAEKAKIDAEKMPPASEPYWHRATSVPFTAACGCDDVDTQTTAIPDRVTCPACLAMPPASEPAPRETPAPKLNRDADGPCIGAPCIVKGAHVYADCRVPLGPGYISPRVLPNVMPRETPACACRHAPNHVGPLDAAHGCPCGPSCLCIADKTPAPSVSDHLLNALNLHRSKCGECSENVDGCETAQRIEAVMCEVNPSAYFTSEPIADDKEQP